MGIASYQKPAEGWIAWVFRDQFARRLTVATFWTHIGWGAVFIFSFIAYWLIGVPSIFHLLAFFLIYLAGGGYSTYTYFRDMRAYLNSAEYARAQKANALLDTEIQDRLRQTRHQ